MKKKIIIPITISLAGLVTLTILNIEKINIEGINILNFFGTVRVSEKTEAEKTASSDSSVSSPKQENIKKDTLTRVTEVTPSSSIINAPVLVQINDTVSTAFLIEGNAEYSDILIKKDDKRFYKFDLAVASAITLIFNAAGRSSYNLNIQGSNNVDINTEIYEERNFTRRMNVYLKAGTYTLKVTGGKYWRENNAGNKYKLKVQISESEKTEAESNESVKTANVIQVNTDIKASSYKGDTDYFTFTLDRRSFIFPRLDFKALNYDLKLYEVRIEDEYGGIIGEFTFRGSNQLSGKRKPVNLNPGNYLVRVSRIEDAMQELGPHEYTLRVSAEI